MLRNFAQSAAQSAVKPVAQFLAPAVDVPSTVGRYKKYSAKHRFHVPETRRGMGGKATRIGFDAEDGTYNCEPHALDFPIDNLEKYEGDQLLNMAKYGATLLADVATLSHEKTVIDMAVAAAGAGTDQNFASTSFDPVGCLDEAIMATIKAAQNSAPVKILFGAQAWLRTKNNAEVKKRLVAAKKSDLSAVTLDGFRSLLFGEPECQMSIMVQDTGAEGLDESISFLLDNAILVFASNDAPTTLDASFMKTFRLMGQWMVPGSYLTEDGRGEVLKMDWSEDPKVTNSAAITRINANAS